MVAKRRLRGAEPFGAPPAPPLVCPLCGRPIVPGPSADEHHLVRHPLEDQPTTSQP